MTAPATALPTVADFLDDATGRLDAIARMLSPCRWEDIDPVAAVGELSRATAALTAALRLLSVPACDTEAGQP